MNVRKMWITPNPEEMILYMARVSNPDNQDNKDARLISFLIKNKHWSPFELANMCVEIKTSRAIAAQILRHRSFSYQEFSQRYASPTEIEPIELRKQANKNRQSSEEVYDPLIYSDGLKNMYASELVQGIVDLAQWTYTKLIEAGVAKECARMILPLATQTTLYMNGTVRSWIHYLALRNDNHAQKEHQLIAQEIEKLFALYFPITYEALQIIKNENTL